MILNHGPRSYKLVRGAMRPKKYYLELYGITYLFFYNHSKDNFEKYMHKNFGVEPDGSYYAGKCFLFVDEGHTVICVYSGKDLSTFTHELIHAGCMTLELVGIDARNDHGEALCYLVGHLHDVAFRQKRKLTKR